MSTRRRPLVVLDRDGVLNEDSPEFVKSAAEWRPLPGALEAVARLTQAGWRVVVATNQSGLARGKFTYQALHAMHQKCEHLLAALGGRIDGWFFCPHGPGDGCACRKPNTGLYDQIDRVFPGGFDGVPSVGDSLRDMAAAQTVGATPVLVRTGNGRRTEAELPANTTVQVADDLAAVVSHLLNNR
ncbi:MAG: D-glycero-beta-D-manno-heptose 1,7-bisphosphate 7-phosphatase [Pseudomonadota bacterium]